MANGYVVEFDGLFAMPSDLDLDDYILALCDSQGVSVALSPAAVEVILPILAGNHTARLVAE